MRWVWCGGWRLRRLRPTPKTGGGPRILLLASHASYRIPAYFTAARRLGIDLTLACEGRYSVVPEAVNGLQIDFSSTTDSMDIVRAQHCARPFHAIVAADDIVVDLASRIAASLGLAHNPPAATAFSRRKDLARRRQTECGIPVPRFWVIDRQLMIEQQISEIEFPVVVKPVALAASRGVIRANNYPELEHAIARTAAITDRHATGEEARFLMVEAYIDGVELAIEGMLIDGRFHTLAIFDKPDPLTGPYFEETYYITPSTMAQDLLARAVERVAQTCSAYGLIQGPVHAELRYDGARFWILEVAARTIGGDCARLLQFGTGQSLEELVFKVAIKGRDIEFDSPVPAAGVLMIPTPRAGILRRVEGLSAARRVLHVVDVEILVREGCELVPLPEGADYLGFAFAAGPTPEAVERALREAHACLNIVVVPSWPVLPA